MVPRTWIAKEGAVRAVGCGGEGGGDGGLRTSPFILTFSSSCEPISV